SNQIWRLGTMSITGGITTGSAGLANNATNYFPAIGTTASNNLGTESSFQMTAPASMTVYAIACAVDTAPGSGKSRAFTLRNAGSDSTMTCTISGTGKTCTATDNSGYAITGGNYINWSSTPTSTPASAIATCVMFYTVDAF